MLLYLTSNENNGVFDFLESSHSFIIKKLSGEFYLRKYVTQDMKNLSHNQYVAIDLKALKDSEDDIIQGIRAIKMLYSSRIIIYAAGIKAGSSILIRLIDEKIYNIVTGDTIADINKVILKCISPEGLGYDDSKRLLNLDDKVKRKEYYFKDKNIKIAVAGAHSRSGATAVSFMLTSFLSISGANVSYTEASPKNDLDLIAEYYDFDKIDDVQYSYSNIDFYRDMMIPSDYNFMIIDLGELNESNIRVFKGCEIRILCAGSKPYEVVNISKFNDIEEFKHHLLINFSSEQGRIKFKKFETENRQLHYLNYAPSLFNEEDNADIFLDILKDHMYEK